MKMKSGCQVPFPDLLEEGYIVKDNGITANVGRDHIESVMQHFIIMHEEPLFFILELPSSMDEESETGTSIIHRMHKDIYYIDNLSQDEALMIMLEAGDLLFDDGLSAFGYGGHKSNEEIVFGKYNELTIYAKDTTKYDSFFKAHDIKKKEKIISAWDTFNADHPGVSNRITVNGKNINSLLEQFKDWGIYFAERREE
ncbi:MAG: hypothetical protein LKE48_08980 [Solobacterium sp.]|jgi:hypothetical protein|nr:hypothetical protein [Solobacterium sp.]